MAAITPVAEFTLKDQYKSVRTSPARWVASHSIRQWPFWLVSVSGAIANAVMASIGPLLIGQAFNAILASPPQVEKLPGLALLVFLTQFSRGLLQVLRNFSFEFIAQRMERDVRNEMYTSLLGKSMTFHSLQAVGDTMARATNDVREINFMFNPGINMVIGSLIFLAMPVIIAPRLHPSLVLTPIVFIILYFFALRRYLATLEPIADEVRLSFGDLNTRLSEAVDGIETVKGAANFEKETYTAVTEARAKIGQVRLSTDQLSDPQAFQKFQQAQDGLSSALSRLMVVSENYPQLKANENFLQLQSQLEGTENRIAVERMKFNQVVQDYNTQIKRFPANIIAGMSNFKEKQYFKAATAAEQAPKVQF